ncbi:MAG: hypothetical protein KC441_00575 [Anaerolineales bacterium]|nr:hypothetical protein [Anaerolineales bacterium]
MTQFIICTLEMFATEAIYIVDAPDSETAVELVKSGQVAYVSHEHFGDGDVFEGVTSIAEIDDASENSPSCEVYTVIGSMKPTETEKEV